MNRYRQIIYFPLIFIIALSVACSHSPKKKLTNGTTEGTGFDTVSYVIKTIRKDDRNCDSTKFKDCRIVDIKYHFFAAHPVLNDSVTGLLLALYPFEKKPASAKTSIEGQADDFVKQYEEFKKEPYSEGRKYELISSTKILTESENLLTLQLDAYTYSGGAHGASFTRFLNYDIGRKKMVRLSDILRDEHARDSLSLIAEQIFKHNEGLKADEPLPRDGYFFDKNKFSLNDTYVFTPSGIMFLYNEYEIKPYAAGKTELVIPYERIRHLVKEGTILQQFLK